MAIVPGGDGLQTQPVADDELALVDGDWVITTGADGRLNTLKHQDDEYQTHPYDGNMVRIEPLPQPDGSGGGGKPGTIAVTPGSDGWLDLDLYIRVDDEIDTSTFDFNDPNLNYDYKGVWEGIDTCASTCIHELVHKENHDDGGEGPSDHDQDGVITDKEVKSSFYLSYCITDTYNVAVTFEYPAFLTFGDDEFLCRMKEMEYVDPNVLSAAGKTDPNSDWSIGGKRWQMY